MEAMRALVVRGYWNFVGWVLGQIGVPLGALIGASASLSLSQYQVAFGGGYGLHVGALLGVLAGLYWPVPRTISYAPLRQTCLLGLYVMALPWIWPAWMSMQLDVLCGLPVAGWDGIWVSDLAAAICGVLSLGIPAALGKQLLCVAASPVSGTARKSVASGLLSAAGTILVLSLGIAPNWGLLIPVLVIELTAVLWCGVVLGPWRATFLARCGLFDEPPVVENSVEPFSPAWQVPALACLAGVQTAGVLAWMFQVMLQTPGAQLAGVTAVLLGSGLAILYRRKQRSAGDFATSAVVASCWALAQLWSGNWLSNLVLWQASSWTSPLAVEIGRAVLILAAVIPWCWWLGWETVSVTNHGTLVRPLVFHLSGVLLAGWLLPTCGGPVNLTLLTAASLLMVAGVSSWQRASTGTEARAGHHALVRSLAPTCIVSAVFVVTLVEREQLWNAPRAVKLAFSTSSLLGARSGWNSRELQYLDDARLVGSVHGREGNWTVWQTHAAECLFRLNGVPTGTLSTHPEWSPQYAADAMGAAWPLVFVDQPASVLMLGAGSGAALQAVLAFPIRDVTCLECDSELVHTIGSMSRETVGVDPFDDARCRWLKQPAAWIALPNSRKYDVVIDVARSPVLGGHGAATLSLEHYRRAARHVAEDGIYCQRLQLVDFGPKVLLTATRTLQQAFPEVACLEVGAGEFLLMGAHRAENFVPANFAERLERPHVVHVLSRCNWDWSLPLNLPAYDRSALTEAADDAGTRVHTALDPGLTFASARELLRWGPKLQETAALLNRPRTSAPVYPLAGGEDVPRELGKAVNRRSRFLEWMGEKGNDQTLLRRLAEVTGKAKLITDYPDAYWWEYRKELREQLQDRPRTAIQQVAFAQTPDKWHPEDRHRKEYFEALGAALRADRPTSDELEPLEELLEPADPLLTLFAHQELADLYSKGRMDPERELEHRLHVIYFAPGNDASVRNVVAAIDLMVHEPEATSDPAERFWRLNGLLQTLRGRWEVRNTRPSKSAKVTLLEVERSLLTVERAIELMGPLASQAGYRDEDWAIRKHVLDRILTRPFRAYRDQLAAHTRESERRTREVLQKATEGKETAAAASNLPAQLPQ